jgi:hypothetical protein
MYDHVNKHNDTSLSLEMFPTFRNDLAAKHEEKN